MDNIVKELGPVIDKEDGANEEGIEAETIVALRGTTRLGLAKTRARITDLRKGKTIYCNSAQQKNTHILCSGYLIYILMCS